MKAITVSAVVSAAGIRLYEPLRYKREWTLPRAWLPRGAYVHRMSMATEDGLCQ